MLDTGRVHPRVRSCRVGSKTGKNLGFLEKVFRVFLTFLRFFRFQCTNETGHKISTKVEHPLHNSLSFRAFSVKYNNTHMQIMIKM